MMKEKHRFDFAWKVACVIFFILAVIFAVLYFGSDAMVTETTIKVDNSQIENGGENGNIVIGSENEIVTGKVETTNNAPLIIAIAIVIGSIFISGGIIIAYHYRKENNDYN